MRISWNSPAAPPPAPAAADPAPRPGETGHLTAGFPDGAADVAGDEVVAGLGLRVVPARDRAALPGAGPAAGGGADTGAPSGRALPAPASRDWWQLVTDDWHQRSADGSGTRPAALAPIDAALEAGAAQPGTPGAVQGVLDAIAAVPDPPGGRPGELIGQLRAAMEQERGAFARRVPTSQPWWQEITDNWHQRSADDSGTRPAALAPIDAALEAAAAQPGTPGAVQGVLNAITAVLGQPVEPELGYQIGKLRGVMERHLPGAGPAAGGDPAPPAPAREISWNSPAAGLTLPEEAVRAELARLVSGQGAAGSLAGCVAVAREFLRSVYGAGGGVRAAGVADDLVWRGWAGWRGRGRGWWRGRGGGGWGRGQGLEAAVSEAGAGAAAVVLVSFAGDRAGHAVVLYATSEGLRRWVDPDGGRVAAGRPEAFGGAVAAWAVVIGPDGRVAGVPGGWSAPESAGAAGVLADPPVRRDFGAMGVEIERYNVRLFWPGREPGVGTVAGAQP